MRLTASNSAVTTPQPFSYHIANVISYAINPLCLPPISAALVTAHFHGDMRQVWWMFGLSTLFFGIVPLLYIVWMVKTGQTSSLEIREREARQKPIQFGILSAFIGCLCMMIFTDVHPALIWGICLIQIGNSLLMMFITLWWKISLHQTGIAGFVATLFFVEHNAWLLPVYDVIRTYWVLPLFLLIPIVAWARVRVSAHTPAQVVGGSVLAFLLTYWLLWLVHNQMYHLVV